MTKILLNALILLFSLQTSAFSAESMEHRDKVFALLKKQTLGKTFAVEQTLKSERDGIESEYKSTFKYTNFELTDNGIRFKLFQSTKQVIFDLDKSNNRVGEPKKIEKDMVFQYELKQSAAAPEYLIGVSYVIANASNDSTGTHSSESLTIKDGVLTMRAVNGMFGDYFSADKRFYPGRTESTVTFRNSVNSDKVERVYVGKTYIVNVETLEGENMSSTLPLVAKEI